MGWKIKKFASKVALQTSVKTFAVGDVFLIGAILIITFYSFRVFFLNDELPKNVEIMNGNRLIADYPLNQNRVIEINGALGPMSVTIHDGAAKVTSSRCRCGICMKTAPIKTPGASIICVPNHITVRIPSKKGSSEFDAIAR